MLLALLLVVAAGPMPEQSGLDEIVVQAKRSRCSVALRGHKMSRREFEAHVRNWAQGVPVRVRASDRASYRCLSKVMFKLNDKGVKTVEFVDPAGGQLASD